MKASILAATVFLATVAISSSMAGPSAEKVESYKTMFRRISKLEMPGKAATEVRSANAKDKKDTAEAILYAAASISPASVPSIVRAMARVAPDLGPELVTRGDILVPKAFTPEAVANPKMITAGAEITPAGGVASGTQGPPFPGFSGSFGGVRTIHKYPTTQQPQINPPPPIYTR